MTGVVLYQNGDFWVTKVKAGYEVYKNGATHSTRCAVIGFRGDEGVRRAVAETDRRANLSSEGPK